jgi:hypothetical protein
MIRLKNNTKGQSKIGYLVIIDPSDKNSFIYAPTDATNILGVIAESVPYRDDCGVITSGEAQIYVGSNVKKGDIIRSRKASDGITNGSSVKSKRADTPFIQIGTALESGNGLINCQLNIFYFGGGGGSSSGGDVLLANTYNKDAVGGILLCSQYNP